MPVSARAHSTEVVSRSGILLASGLFYLQLLISEYNQQMVVEGQRDPRGCERSVLRNSKVLEWCFNVSVNLGALT